jgi:DUF4097 and DUF4098 domain-containing protein YvlB
MGRMTITVRAVFTAALVAMGAAQSQEITREGAYWVRTITGTGAIPSSTRMRVTANGDVTVRGAAQNNYWYSVKLRIKARNQAQASALLSGLHVTAGQRGDHYLLSVPAAAGMSDMRVNVPRSLREVIVSTTEGGIDVADLGGAARCETGGGGVRCDRIGGNLTVTTAGGGISLGTVDGMAHCITAGGGINVNVIRGEAIFESGGGDIVIQEVGGMLRASTGGGGIKIVRAGSAVIANTGGGPIEVGHAGGQVTAKSSGGPIHVDAASGVQCESASGGIRLRNISGSLRASTAMGSISATLLGGHPFADSFLTTGSGDITVFIPSNLGVTIRAENELADSLRRIISDYPGITVKLREGRVVGEGTVNGGGPVLRIAGTGGTIYIKRQ